jgi:hypothetical protein
MAITDDAAGSGAGRMVIADGKIVNITLPTRDVIGPGSSQPPPDGDGLLETEPSTVTRVISDNESDLADATTAYTQSVQHDTGGHFPASSDHVSGTIIMGGMLVAAAIEKIRGRGGGE